MSPSQGNLEQVLEKQIQTLALTLRRGTTDHYRSTVRRFLAYLQADFPQLRRPSQLRRDPHLLGWFRSLNEEHPRLNNHTRIGHLIHLRRLLDGLAANGHRLPPDLIRREDFPPPSHYLPRPLSLEEDRLLRAELLRNDDLYANALLLIRATGIRIGECIRLPLDCLRQVGAEQWALHVPLGKLHTERLVPVDSEVQRILQRILKLRVSAPAARYANSQGFLLPRRGRISALMQPLGSALARAARRAGCPSHVTSHRLRHYASSGTMRSSQRTLGASPAKTRLPGAHGLPP